ncbi:hypothetical protein V6R21_08800 [Limibacter armeniacum]|uniref:hypothetical protein n=1 Tax=Limibacter armeniacum TaxID=466084 RepID=UPI002FE58CBD
MKFLLLLLSLLSFVAFSFAQEQRPLEIPYVADLHCHSSLKPFRQEAHTSIFDGVGCSGDCFNRKRLPLLMKAKNFPIGSQASFSQCQQGKNKVVFLSMHIPEVQMMDIRNIWDFFTSDNRMENFWTRITGFHKDFIRYQLMMYDENEPINYFKELEREYAYLLTQEQHDTGGKFVIARNYQHMKEVLENEPGTIIGIMNLEGMHNLINYQRQKDFWLDSKALNDPTNPEYIKYHKMLEENIKKVKSWGGGEHAPVYATMTHSFWNMVAGQAPVVPKTVRALGLKQRPGLHEGFTELGRSVLEMLLSKENGRRVLPDVKHLSREARKEYYSIWESYRAKGDTFPIIFSHAAVSGIKHLDKKDKEEELVAMDKLHKPYHGYFNRTPLNLCDEDIWNIFRSRGIIGMMMDEKRLLGRRSKTDINKVKKAGDEKALQMEYMKAWMAHVFYIIEQCQSKEAWSMICIGSDFDGVIDSMKAFPNAESFPEMAEVMVEFLRSHENLAVGLDRKKIEKLMYGYEPEELVEMVMYKNIDRFLEKNFAPDKSLVESLSN